MDLPGSGPLWDPPSLNHRPHPRKGSSFRRLKCSQTSFLTVTAGLLQKKTSRGGRRCWLHGVGELWESSAEWRFVIKVIANRFWQFWRFWESSWIQWWKNPNWTAWQIKTQDQDLGHWWHEVSINLKTNVINRQICKCDRILWKHVRQQQLVRTLGHWSTVVNLHWEVLYFPAVSSHFCSVQTILCGLIWFEAPRDLWDCTSGLLRISWMYGRAVHCWVKLVWMPQKVQHYCKTACSKTAPYPVHSE